MQDDEIAIQYNTRQDKTRHDKSTQKNTRQHITKQDKSINT